MKTKPKRRLPKKVINELEESRFTKGAIKTQIIPLDQFYPAEDYHQTYTADFPAAYKRYKVGSGRQDYINRERSE